MLSSNKINEANSRSIKKYSQLCIRGITLFILMVTQMPHPPSYWDAMLSRVGTCSRNITSCGPYLMIRLWGFNHGWCTVQQLWQCGKCCEAPQAPWSDIFLVHAQAVSHPLVAKLTHSASLLWCSEKSSPWLADDGWKAHLQWMHSHVGTLNQQECWHSDKDWN